jgi:LmbE family N-acetylglucosaminyl deacetylase
MIRKYAPSIIYTHFWGDMNQDHRITFDATQIAIRPIKKPIIKKLLCFETPSSTEWGLGKTPFHPNTFVDISKSIKKKIEAMEKYEHEVEPFPHPRSKKSILSRSNYWGTFIGMENVEPFMLMRELSNLNSI